MAVTGRWRNNCSSDAPRAARPITEAMEDALAEAVERIRRQELGREALRRRVAAEEAPR